MMRRTAVIGPAIAILLVVATHPVFGQEATDGLDPCVAAYRESLAREERFFRTVIYGQPEAENSRTGSIRYDTTGGAWVKIAPNSWRSLVPGFEQTQWSDTQMDSQSEHPERRGLVEIREALTSEVFVTPATQALRALRCRMAAVCMAADESEFSTNATVTVQPLGCLPVTMPTLPACRFAGRAPENARITSLSGCVADRSATLQLEADLLRMTAAYDSSYRSLLQFAGSYEGFIDDLRDPLLQPMRRAVDMFLELRQLPCFISECNA